MHQSTPEPFDKREPDIGVKAKYFTLTHFISNWPVDFDFSYGN